MNEPISGALDRLAAEGSRAVVLFRAQVRTLSIRALAQARRWRAIWSHRGPAAEEATKPVSNALVKLTAEGGKVILALPERGRALVRRVPEPVQIELKKLSVRSAHVCREIFAGILVVGLVAIVLGYGRLGHGPISLAGLVPTIEAAINGEL